MSVAPMVGEESRTCKHCGLEKDVSHFEMSDGRWRRRTCRECYRLAKRTGIPLGGGKLAEWRAERDRLVLKGQRRCSACKEVKSLEAFTWRRSKGVWTHACIACESSRKTGGFFESRTKKGTVEATAKDLLLLWQQQRGRCAITGEKLTRHNAHVDHIVPRSRGGSNTIDNLRWTWSVANEAKRNLTDDEFLGLCARTILTLGPKTGWYKPSTDQ